VRVAESEEQEGVVVLFRPAPEGNGLRGVFAGWSFAMSPRRFHLDAVGAFVWQRLDGDTTVAEIADAVREEFGGDKIDERLGLFIRALRTQGMVAYPGWDE